MNEPTVFRCPHCGKATMAMLEGIDGVVRRYQHAEYMRHKCVECGKVFTYGFERIIVFNSAKTLICDECDEEYLPAKPLTDPDIRRVCEFCLDEG